jgi:hypothetical protein
MRNVVIDGKTRLRGKSMSKLDLDAVGQDIRIALHECGLQPTSFAVNLAVTTKDFDAIATDHPDRIGLEIVRKNGITGGVRWQIQILRRRTLEDFPPGAIKTPPP